MYHYLLLFLIIFIAIVYSSSKRKHREFFVNDNITKEQIEILSDLRKGSINIKDVRKKEDIDAIVKYLVS